VSKLRRLLFLQELLENMEVTRVPGIGLFYSDTAHGVPAVFTHFLTHLPALPEVRMASFSSSFE
jgi:KUP system potassium uptake protein